MPIPRPPSPRPFPPAALSLVLLLALPGVPAALSMDNYLVKLSPVNPTCRSFSFLASREVMAFEGRGARDSAAALNESLEKYCGPSEQVHRYRLLSRMRSGGFDPARTSLDLDRLLEYRERMEYVRLYGTSLDRLAWKFGYFADPAYDSLTLGMARALADTSDPDIRAVKNLYTHDFAAFAAALRSPDNPGVLAREARSRLEKAHTGFRIFGSLFAGAWIPGGGLRVVNEHPYFGARFGLGLSRFNGAFRFGLNLPNGPYRYQVVFRDSLIDADNFGGVMTAFEPSLEVYRTLLWKVSAVASLGWTFQTAYVLQTPDPDDEDPDVALHGPELSLGLRVDRLWGTGGLWGLEGKYAWYSIDNPGGTELEGGAFQLLVHLGVEGSPRWLRARGIWR